MPSRRRCPYTRAGSTNGGTLNDRASVAEDLINWHFQTDDDLEEVYLDLGREDEPIRLLEIHGAVVTREVFEPFTFSRSKEVPYRTSIALVRREELERLRPELPAPWRGYETWQRFERPRRTG